MRPRHPTVSLACLALLAIAACGRSPSPGSPTERTTLPSPTPPAGASALTAATTVGVGRHSHGRPLRDHVSLVDHLRAEGLEVDPVAKARQPFLTPPGTRLRIRGGGLRRAIEIQSYDYDGADLGTDGLRVAEEDARNIGSAGQPRTMRILWDGTPHFYREVRVLVLYAGEDRRALELLRKLLGPPFAGGSASGGQPPRARMDEREPTR